MSIGLKYPNTNKERESNENYKLFNCKLVKCFTLQTGRLAINISQSKTVK